ncbi:MAG TPA: malate/lactate/ureidoglycolate dehydrogenase [Xanthobacteraceae bacterium]|nr:malate/lactate/ureidoglycolate dehydrogenase [Xanthobacteraceae bacterium]
MKIEAGVLQDFVGQVFTAAGCSAQESARVAASLVKANLVGHDSHGVVRVPRYVQGKLDGKVKPDQKVAVLTETPVLAVVDGRHGFGQTVAPQAVAIGIAKCKAMGLSLVALRNAGHIGRVGDYAELAAAEGLVSVHFVNVPGSVLVAPFGGVERRISTAPFCVGVPRPGEEAIVLDFATSVVAEGKVLVASQGGKPLPDNAMIGPGGEINGDPRLLYGDYEPDGPRDYRKGKGAIRAFGEHKGSGLAIMCELLGGSLTGAGATELRDVVTNGMLSIYIDPARLDPDGFFPRDVARYLAYLKSAKPAKPGGEVLVPGEPEARTRATRLRDGIDLPDDTWAAIVATARSLGVAPPHNLVGGPR